MLHTHCPLLLTVAEAQLLILQAVHWQHFDALHAPEFFLELQVTFLHDEIAEATLLFPHTPFASPKSISSTYSLIVSSAL